MIELAGPFAIACVFVAVGGALKALHPADTARALAALHLPHRHALVRAGGGLEVVLGTAALLLGGPLALGVAASYLIFAGFVLAALRAGSPISTCGCLGKVDTPPTFVHVGLNLAFAAVAAVAAFTSGIALPDVLSHQPLAGIPFLLLLAVGCALVALAWSSLPKTLALAREVRA